MVPLARLVVCSTTGLRPNQASLNETESLFRFENATNQNLQSIFRFLLIGKCSKGRRDFPAGRGYERLFAEHVTQADAGCDFDFLHGAAGVPEPAIY